jgi:hypothetical protein
MRKRMIRNDLFYLHYPFRENYDSSEDKPHKYRRPTSYDSRRWYEIHHDLAMFERESERLSVELEYDDCDVAVQDKSLTIDEQIRNIGFQGLRTALSQATAHNQSKEQTDLEEDSDSAAAEAEETVAEAGEFSDQSPNSPERAKEHHPEVASAILYEEESPDYQMVMRLLENGERITHMYRQVNPIRCKM